jgi:AraC-like DNA-binding protein
MTLLTLEPGGWLAPLVLTAPAKPVLAADPQEAGLLDALSRLMEADRAYREEGLGIAALATRLKVPEYRLRRLINQRLGHRNFAAFLNGYRLQDAMSALADPTQDEVPILTIALDAGFSSIGVFNRAFKTTTGVTPTEYRRHRPSSEIG